MAADAADYKKGARLCRGLCRRVVHRFAQGATALRAEGDGGALRAQIIKSALRDWLSVSYGMISMLVIGSLRSPPLSGLCHWTHLRCEGSQGSEGSKGGAIALSGDEFYRPSGEADPFHHWRGPPPPASRGRQVYRGAVPFKPAREYP